MCFSAEASFTASAALLGIGTLTMRRASRSSERPYAAIPLLFGVQQLAEGLLWLGFSWETAALNAVLTQVYSFFSHVLWPVYVPLAAWCMEPPGWRRRALSAAVAGGAAIGAYLLYSLFANPIVARPVGNHIDYDSPHFYVTVVMTLYLATTTVSLLLSSRRTAQLFGFLALAASAAAYLFYVSWFISVWCFFAAVLSLMVYFQRNAGSAGRAAGPLLAAGLPNDTPGR
jgi:hypothetical protein